MSDVKRYYVSMRAGVPILVEASEAYMAETGTRGIVKGSDVDKLEAEAQALRDELAALHSQVKTLQSDANSWQSGYDEGRRMGTKHRQSEVEQLTRDVAALRVKAVVVPDELLQRCREILGWQKTGTLMGNALRNLGRARWPGDPNELQIAESETAREAYRFIDELARLNGKAVSEGLLRRTLGFIKATNYQGSIPLGLIADLSDLLGDGKEVGDA